jgi:hypothetical protein
LTFLSLWVRAWSRHDVTLSSLVPTQTIPLVSLSSQQSPFDIPKPQESSKVLTLHLELQLKSYRSHLEARKQLLSASIKALARLEAGPSDHQETDEERLARLVDKRGCVNWITKV